MIQPAQPHIPLPGKQPIRRHRAGADPRLAEWIVARLRNGIATRVQRHARRAEMVFEHVVQVVVPALDDAHRARCRVVERSLRDRRAVQFNFVNSADVDGDGSIRLEFLDEIPITVVDEGRALAVDSDRREAIFDVELLPQS